MNFMQFFRNSLVKEKKEINNSASIAKERLQIIVAHERINPQTNDDFLVDMQQDIMRVVLGYITVPENSIRVRMENEGDCSVLEVNVQLPSEMKKTRTSTSQ